MAAFCTVPLFIALSVLCFFLAAADKFKLATQICKNTTDFNFCRDAVFSAPHADSDDRVDLAYIIFGKAYLNTTSTQKYIDSVIKSIEASGGGHSGTLRGLKKCKVYYQEAFRTLEYDMLFNLNSEDFYEFDKSSIHVEDQAHACEKGFHGQSPMTKRNHNLIKLAKICYAVSLLFPYT